MTPRMDSLERVRHLTVGQVSLKVRLGYVALLLVSIAMTTVVASLWLTEPTLPPRTQLAFGGLTFIGLSWTALATWVLSTRRPLFARDRVIAGRMAVAFTSIFVVGAGAAVSMAGNVASFGVLALSAVMLALALKVLASARQRFAALLARKTELERA
jgi:hypothetical protein